MLIFLIERLPDLFEQRECREEFNKILAAGLEVDKRVSDFAYERLDEEALKEVIAAKEDLEKETRKLSDDDLFLKRIAKRKPDAAAHVFV